MLTAIVPATNRPDTLPQCLAAIQHATAGPEQVIVVEDPSLRHPSLARNSGASRAVGDVLVFVDADVTVHPDAFVRIRRAFAADPSLVALFGSYDDAPAAPGVVSRFRNLLHHHVHQSEGGPAGTFWAGLGAVRRDAFEVSGGFLVHPLEDIELGMRLSKSGARILLDPDIQGTRLKAWSVWSMARTDLLVRGIPWVGLLPEYRGSASGSALNLATLNFSFYGLLARREGPLRATAGVAQHVLHLWIAVISVPLGVLAYYQRPWALPARQRGG